MSHVTPLFLSLCIARRTDRRVRLRSSLDLTLIPNSSVDAKLLPAFDEYACRADLSQNRLAKVNAIVKQQQVVENTG